MAKLELRNAGFIYNPGTEFQSVALEDVSVAFEENAVTGIIGHTGSGKSTLVQLLNGLLAPTSGQVFLDGRDIHETKKDRYAALLSEAERSGEKVRRHTLKKQAVADCKAMKRNICFRVGLVMQYPEAQLFEETVRKDIAFGPANMGLSKEEIDARIEKVARLVGLNERQLNKSPFDLSGGQKRRAAIAGVLAMEPDVLILDEPAAGLDPKGRETVFDCIRRYREECRTTVLIVSHSMEDMAAYCDRVLVLAEGRVLMHGTREEVFGQISGIETHGLDVPEITHLMNMLRDRGYPVPDGIYTVEDAVKAVMEIAHSVSGKGADT